MATRFLDDDARLALQGAIEAIERASSAEVVVAVRRQSAGYPQAPFLAALATAMVALAYMLFSAHAFSLPSILIDPFVAGALAAGLVELVSPLKRALVSRRARRRAVERGARVAFFDRGVANTGARNGVLVYLSWLEGDCAVLADHGVPVSFRERGLRELERDLAAAMPRGGAAVAERLGKVAAELGELLPRQAADRNELPDDLDADLARRGPR